MTLILGIESSCDETAAAVVEDGRTLLANVVASQVELHEKYGGVFPEMASRQHMVTITPVIREALEQAGLGWRDLGAIAVVQGPGLSGSLLVGVNVAKALAWAQGLPLIGVNHIEAHLYANWLVPPGGDPEAFRAPSFPLICLIVSGGHTDLVVMREHHDYERLGHTLDDAAGEAFDKVARLLGLGYPGGPAIQASAVDGDPTAYPLPRAVNVGPYDFSFSGLKTAVLRLVQELRQERGEEVDVQGEKLAEAGLAEQAHAFPVADLAASFQAALVDALVTRTAYAASQYEAVQVLIAGGVAANRLLREEMTHRLEIPVRFPPIAFCTDNAAMVAAAGYYRYLEGKRSHLDLDVIPDLSLVT
ncbi:MAG: tRNA (adenosine(37)-N6)-threonylcarbamoyltransferase complex transferase subunit TsaD [Anaerolineae bacterium]|nr:tRNA (adenosine(37)-N6)-threonylcarbamoyltransferase complex transferase subunit TsaD [Anaerolineae bacterium]